MSLYLGTGEDHEYLLPVMTFVVENILKSSIEEIKKLILKCDGMMANINVPSKIIKILKDKYSNNYIISDDRKYKYSINLLDKIILVCFYHYIYHYIMFILSLYIAWYMWMA